MRGAVISVVIVVTLLIGAGAGFLIGGIGSSPPRANTSVSATTVTSTLYSTRTLTLVQGSGQLGPWNTTTSFPGAHPPSSCIASQGFIYCVGGNGNATYFAQISSDGIGQWKRSTDYPVPIAGESCVENPDYIYCVGGVSQGPGNQTADKFGRTVQVFYAPLTASGFGQWAQTTVYPYVAASPACTAYSSRVYCVEDSFNGSGYSSPPLGYSADLSTNGVGTWVQSTAPPTGISGCTAIGGYAYCFGGGICIGPGSCRALSYSANITGGGIGNWSQTTDLPMLSGTPYVTAGPHVYYFSVPVFYADPSDGHVGPWVATTDYPGQYPSTCASDGTFIYCIGEDNTAAYSQVGAPNPGALVLLNPPPYFPEAEYLTPAWNGGSGCSVTFAGGTVQGAPCFTPDIDEAVIFDCAVTAATPTGCETTVVSPTNTAYNYNMTIWYPVYNATIPDSNCKFLPSGYSSPFTGWCISISQYSFVIAWQLQPVSPP